MKRNKRKRKTKKHQKGGFKCKLEPSVYLMLGHGCSNEQELDMPSDCAYITSALCGNNVKTNDSYKPYFLQKFIDKDIRLYNPCDINNFTWLNNLVMENSRIKSASDAQTSVYFTSVDFTSRPDNHLGYLNMHVNPMHEQTDKNISSLPKYLDSYYSPLSIWFYNINESKFNETNSEDHTLIIIQPSGLREITYDNIGIKDRRIICCDQQRNKWKYPMLTQEDINFLYSTSLYPSLSYVNQLINGKTWLYDSTTGGKNRNNYLKDNYKEPISEDIILKSNRYVNRYVISSKDLYDIIHILGINQSALFRKFKGVHYNLVCRGFCQKTPKEFSERRRSSSIGNREELDQLYVNEREAIEVDVREASEASEARAKEEARVRARAIYDAKTNEAKNEFKAAAAAAARDKAKANGNPLLYEEAQAIYNAKAIEAKAEARAAVKSEAEIRSRARAAARAAAL
jgi:hypothetical protein